MAITDKDIHKYFGPNLLRAVMKTLYSHIVYLYNVAGQTPPTAQEFLQEVKDNYQNTAKMEFDSE